MPEADVEAEAEADETLRLLEKLSGYGRRLDHENDSPPQFMVSEEVEYADLLGFTDVIPPITEAIDAGVHAVVMPKAIPDMVTLQGEIGVKV